MAESWGPVHSYQQVWFSYSVSNISSTVTRVTISSFLHVRQDASVTGTFTTWWSGDWGTGSAAVSVSSPMGSPTNHFLSGGASFDFARGTSDRKVYFAASIITFLGGVEHGVYVDIPKVPATVPPAPTASPLSNITASSMRYVFSSNGNGGSAILGWEFQYSPNSNFSGATTVASTGTSTVTGLDSGKRYYFRSRGRNALGWGSWSNTVSATTLSVPSTPTLTLGSPAAKSFPYSIADPSNTGGASITEYETQIRDNSTGTVLRTMTTKTGTATGLSRAHAYSARSRVRNSVGWSSWTGWLNITTLAEIPSVPTGYGSVEVASTSAYVPVPVVADDGGAPISQVRAYRNTSPTVTGATLFTLDSLRDVLLTNLNPGSTYYVALQVYNTSLAGGGWSNLGAWTTFETRSDVPTSPSVSVTAIADNSALLQWTAPDDLLGSELFGYVVRVARDPAFAVGLQTFSDPYEDALEQPLSLSPATKYWAQVRADSAEGPGSWSSIISFTTTGSAGIVRPVSMKIAGVWQTGTLFIRDGGVFKRIIPWQKVAGTWRKGS